MSSDYKIEGNIIRSPGKFEGEPYYVPLFYDMMLEGFADEEYDEEDRVYWTFDISEDDSKRFPELSIGDKLLLIEDDNGFVYSLIEER